MGRSIAASFKARRAGFNQVQLTLRTSKVRPQGVETVLGLPVCQGQQQPRSRTGFLPKSLLKMTNEVRGQSRDLKLATPTLAARPRNTVDGRLLV